jgi:hypothetical protein
MPINSPRRVLTQKLQAELHLRRRCRVIPFEHEDAVVVDSWRPGIDRLDPRNGGDIHVFVDERLKSLLQISGGRLLLPKLRGAGVENREVFRGDGLVERKN